MSFLCYYESPVGRLQLQATETALSSLLFVGGKHAQADLPEAYPDVPILKACTAQLTAYFNGELQIFELPFAQTGTPFQQRVWAALYEIPYGETISYLTLAKRLGDEKVIRAAASANGANKIAIVVPCHRVIGANGSLVGFAGGLWRKEALLALERKVKHGIQTLF